jgi:hypothetical protein
VPPAKRVATAGQDRNFREEEIGRLVEAIPVLERLRRRDEVATRLIAGQATSSNFRQVVSCFVAMVWAPFRNWLMGPCSLTPEREKDESS